MDHTDPTTPTDPRLFQIPLDPTDATLEVIITITPAGDQLVVYGETFPPTDKASTSAARAFMDKMNFIPRVGTYRIALSLSNIEILEVPEGTTPGERCALTYVARRHFSAMVDALISACSQFPRRLTGMDEVALMILMTEARQVSLPGRNAQFTPIEQLKTTGFDCVECFKRDMMRGMSASERNGLLIAVMMSDEGTKIAVGYLSHNNPFAQFFNDMLANRVREGLQMIYTQVVLDIMASHELIRRVEERIGDALATAFPEIDESQSFEVADRTEINVMEELGIEVPDEYLDPDDSFGEGTDPDDSNSDSSLEFEESPMPEPVAPNDPDLGVTNEPEPTPEPESNPTA